MATGTKAKKLGQAGAAAKGGTLTVTTARNARFLSLTKDLQRAFKEAGCPGCRSGMDRIVFKDRVVRSVK